MIILIILLCILLFLSAFFSSTETVYYLADNKVKSKYVSASTDSFLTFILISNTMVNIFIGIISEKLTLNYLFKDRSLIFSIVLSTFLLLFFGEILPKRLALKLYKKLQYINLPVMQAYISKFKFVDNAVQFFSNSLEGLKIESKVLSINEVKKSLTDGLKKKLFQPAQTSLVLNIISLTSGKVKDLMVHYTDIPHITLNTKLDHILKAFKDTDLSFFPVTSKDYEKTYGYISKKDLLSIDDFENFSVSNILKPLDMIYENDELYIAIQRFNDLEDMILGIYDEHFQYCGIIEYDTLVDKMLHFEKNILSFSYPIIMESNVSCSMLGYLYDIYLPEQFFDSSLLDFFMNYYQNVPSIGASIEVNGFVYKVIRMKKNKVSHFSIYPVDFTKNRNRNNEIKKTKKIKLNKIKQK
ncbi:MAG TPA: CNNM domain-containing protein [Exilispira sp.]|nr:DUF21 domain-containing protein [Spirochaetota bacterium]HPB47989.1 CNNM domain-containing protein [Exilispira sp.]HQQ19357.1 CNNM domain-containing protein [Exilispira sp.]